MTSHDIQNLGEDQQELSNNYALDPQELVYEAPAEQDDQEQGGLDAKYVESGNAVTVEAEEAEAPNEVEHLEVHQAEVRSEESGPKDEQNNEHDVSEVLEDEPIVYASEDRHDPVETASPYQEDGEAPQDEYPRVDTAERKPGSSAEGYRNVDGLVGEMDPAYYQSAGGLNDYNDLENLPAAISVSGYDVADDELVVADVDLLGEGEGPIAANGSVSTKGSSPHVFSPTPPSSSSSKKLIEVHESVGEDPAEKDDSAYANMHPSIAQAIKTRNSHFPLLDDPKLPHTRENFNLPPLVEGHTIPVTRGTYSDYTFDLERQEYLQREEVTKAHTEYLEAHYELKQIVSDFLTSILTDKPTDVYQYAADYFNAAID